MLEERQELNRKDIDTKERRGNSQKKGPVREFISQQEVEPKRKYRKYESENELQEYEDGLEADVRGG